MKVKMNQLDWATWVFLVIGAVNWGLVGAFKFDLVMTMFGTSPALVQVVYILVGLSGLYSLYRMLMMRK
jgi:uncharacterized membrane protein YuzA (DUF378 family)